MGRFPLVEKEIVSEEKNKPVLDEQTLGRLLEAAYVLQEHNRELHEMELGLSLKRDQIEADELSTPHSQRGTDTTAEPAAETDYTFTLAKIVEAQHQIQVRHLNLGSAMSLVAERLVPITRASGTAIGILDGKTFHYRAMAGLHAAGRHCCSNGQSPVPRLPADWPGFSLHGCESRIPSRHRGVSPAWNPVADRRSNFS